MLGDILFQVFGAHSGKTTDFFMGAFRTRAEAEAEIGRLQTQEFNGANWAEQYYDLGFTVREAVVATDFEVPPRPTPRERYFATGTVTSTPTTWTQTRVGVFRRSPAGDEAVAEYDRNYALLQTFEPFRQGGREFALISRDYTATAVLDLQSGQVIAEEEPASGGFCPVGFYVPDWWDVHGGSKLPGSPYWSADDEWPVGDFGFVWGCVWGDDTAWKVQHLDLSRVSQGILGRDERFGYVELATDGYTTPCLTPGPGVPGRRPPFIHIERYQSVTRVRFAVEMDFDLASGKAAEWARLNAADLE